MKRLLDIILASFGLLIFLPILLLFIFLIWTQDFRSPFYSALRIGRDGKKFNMYKLRSMKVGSDKSGVESTSKDDERITKIGFFIRASKMDELSQLWNVLFGSMSIVGPRPNTPNGVSVYTDKEKELLSIRPGITDISSIVFSDEGDILMGKKDPDDSYDKLIRPWKSKLGLLYVQKQSLLLDFKLIIYTCIAIYSRERALNCINIELQKISDNLELIQVCRRKEDLYPSEPPRL